jgi:hypothetical protein
MLHMQVSLQQTRCLLLLLLLLHNIVALSCSHTLGV